MPVEVYLPLVTSAERERDFINTNCMETGVGHRCPRVDKKTLMHLGCDSKEQLVLFIFLLTLVGVVHKRSRALGPSSMTDPSSENIHRKSWEGAACGM